MTPKSSTLEIAFKVTPKVKNKAQIMTVGLSLKVMSNWNDIGAILLDDPDKRRPGRPR